MAEETTTGLLGLMGGLVVGLNWKPIAKFLEPHFKEVVKWGMVQKEHIEDIMAEIEVKKVKKPTVELGSPTMVKAERPTTGVSSPTATAKHPKEKISKIKESKEKKPE